MSEPNIRQVAAFVAVLNHGSASRAGEIVGLTQSALTQAVARLEQEVGCRLFEREPRGMRPTEPAMLLAPRAKAALARIGSTRITATQIRGFLAFARAGGFTAGARTVEIAPASLHRSISDLSIALRERLIERRGRHMLLTPRGVARARDFGVAMAELRSGFSEIAEWLGHHGGRIVIGAMPLSRAQWLPSAIRRFHASYPKVELAIVEGSHGELIGPLRDGEIDLILGALREDTLFDDISQDAVFDDRPQILARSGHQLFEAGADTLAVLATSEWILPRAGTPIRDHWTAMLAAMGVPIPDVSIECGSPLTVRELLLDSDMITLLSPDQVRLEIEGGLLSAMAPSTPIIRTIGIMSRKDWRPTPTQARMMQILREVGPDLSHNLIA